MSKTDSSETGLKALLMRYLPYWAVSRGENL